MGVFSEVAERVRGQYVFQVRDNQALPTLNDLLLAISKGMDLLEGKPLRSAMKVAVIAGSIARLMQLPSREVYSIVYAALLHDIGLARLVAEIHPHLPPGFSEKQLFQSHALMNARIIGTPHERPFSAELTHLLTQHPLAAKDLIEKLHLSGDVAELVAAHHELCDGSGYPFGLKAEQIPLGAKILAFADVAEGALAGMGKELSGLTTRRHALESFLEIKTQEKFDSTVVETFRRLIDEHEDFLRQIATLELEQMVRQLMPERIGTVSGPMLHNVLAVMGSLSDSLMPFYKSGRVKRTSEMAIKLAESLGIHREQCGELAAAAMLMDIGYLGVPISLLLKSGSLTADERAVIHDHPVMARDVLKGIPGFENIVLWSTEAHERMNGKGYPGQKKSYEISVGGRILALVDVFDALTSRRPYRGHAHEPMDALPVIGQGRMTLFDNQLVTQLRKVVLESEVVVR